MQWIQDKNKTITCLNRHKKMTLIMLNTPTWKKVMKGEFTTKRKHM